MELSARDRSTDYRAPRGEKHGCAYVLVGVGFRVADVGVCLAPSTTLGRSKVPLKGVRTDPTVPEMLATPQSAPPDCGKSVFVSNAMYDRCVVTPLGQFVARSFLPHIRSRRRASDLGLSAPPKPRQQQELTGLYSRTTTNKRPPLFSALSTLQIARRRHLGCQSILASRTLLAFSPLPPLARDPAADQVSHPSRSIRESATCP